MRMRNVLPLLVLIVIAFVLRFNYLDQPMRYDESLTFLNYAAQPLTTALSTYNEPNNHLFHTLLVHLSSRVFGDAPWALRLPAFIAGLLIIPALYWTAGQFFNRRAALLAAALCAVSVALIEFSVNARGYTLIALFFVLLLGLAKYVLTHDRRWVWGAFALMAALGFYTIPVFVYPMGIVALWLLLSLFALEGDRRWYMLIKFALALAVGGALTVLLYLPIIQNQGMSAITGNQFVTQLPASVFYASLGEIWTLFWGFVNRGFDPLVQVILVIGVIVSLVFRARIQPESARQTRVPLLLVAAIWLGIVLFFQRVIPFDRTWIFFVPLYAMLAAAGIAYVIRDSTWFVLASVGLVAGVIFSVVTTDLIRTSELTGYAPDAEAVALYAINDLDPEDRLFIPTPLDEPVRYYLRLHGAAPERVFNQYQTGWIDLMASTDQDLYVVGVPLDDQAAFEAAFELGDSPYRYALLPTETFPVQVMQRIAAPAFASGVLFSDNFDGTLTPGWQINGSEPRIINQSGEQVLLINTETWTELTIDGGSQWRDYVVGLRVQFTRLNAQFDELGLHVRNEFGVVSAAATFNVDREQIGIGGDLEGAWGGYLQQADYPLQRSRYYDLQVEVSGDVMTIWIDGEQVLQASGIAATRGTFRIVIPPDVRLSLDNVIIRPVGL